MSSNADRLRVAATRGPNEEAKRLAEMKPKEQIAYLLEKKSAEIKALLPAHLNHDRLLKVAQIAATTTPTLAKCDVASLVGAIGQCAQMGLEPNTVLGHAYLVPFNTKRKDAEGNERWVNSVQVIVGYKGLIDLARRSGQIVSIAAHEVCEKDEFELVYGLEEKLQHKPALGERGAILGFYAVAHLKGGGHAFEWMSKAQIEAVRDGSQGWQQAVKLKKQDAHPWAAHFTEMGRKTVIRRLAKYLPLSVEFQTAAALDEQAAAGRDQHLDAIDGSFMNLGAEDGATDGAEDDAPPPPAVTDAREEQEARRVPQETRARREPETVTQAAQQFEPEGRAQQQAQVGTGPSALAKVEAIIGRALDTGDTETAHLALDDAAFVADTELQGDERERAVGAITEARASLAGRAAQQQAQAPAAKQRRMSLE